MKRAYNAAAMYNWPACIVEDLGLKEAISSVFVAMLTTP